MDSAAELEKAKEYYRRGDRIMARSIIANVVKIEPRNTQGWLLLWVVVDDADQKNYCLNRVIDIDPNNEQALRLLGTQMRMEESTQKMNNAIKLRNFAGALGSVSWALIVIGLLLPCIVICVGTLLSK